MRGTRLMAPRSHLAELTPRDSAGVYEAGRAAKLARALPPKGSPFGEGHGTPSGSSGASASSEAGAGPPGGGEAPAERGASGSPRAASDVASVAATAGGTAIGTAAGSPDTSQHGAGTTAGSSPDLFPGLGYDALEGSRTGGGGGMALQPVREAGELAQGLEAAEPLSDVSTSLTAWLSGEPQRPVHGEAAPRGGVSPGEPKDADLARRLEAAVAAGLELAQRDSGALRDAVAVPAAARERDRGSRDVLGLSSPSPSAPPEAQAPAAEDPATLNFWPPPGGSARPVFGIGAGAAALRSRLWDDSLREQAQAAAEASAQPRLAGARARGLASGAPPAAAAAASASDPTDPGASAQMPRTRSLSEGRQLARGTRGAGRDPPRPPWDPRQGPLDLSDLGRVARERRAWDPHMGPADARWGEGPGVPRAAGGTLEPSRKGAPFGEHDTRTSVEVERGGWNPAQEGCLSELLQVEAERRRPCVAVSANPDTRQEERLD
ncbi:hypothetical protein WJX81_004777 [Elliptochloris bilobata]|uniref:Uncharacterized protein n=1 Tax=Elliptochloris bilobata TaxID=381761 RepID=A0AAW1R1K1_9CHLO